MPIRKLEEENMGAKFVYSGCDKKNDWNEPKYMEFFSNEPNFLENICFRPISWFVKRNE